MAGGPVVSGNEIVVVHVGGPPIEGQQVLLQALHSLAMMTLILSTEISRFFVTLMFTLQKKYLKSVLLLNWKNATMRL